MQLFKRLLKNNVYQSLLQIYNNNKKNTNFLQHRGWLIENKIIKNLEQKTIIIYGLNKFKILKTLTTRYKK